MVAEDKSLFIQDIVHIVMSITGDEFFLCKILESQLPEDVKEASRYLSMPCMLYAEERNSVPREPKYLLTGTKYSFSLLRGHTFYSVRLFTI